MDINIVKNNLKEDYNCELVDVINYANRNFIKGIEVIDESVSYRYFVVKKDNKLEEILDELLLAYFKENNETNENIEY